MNYYESYKQVYGLTGIIGSGKSSAAQLFSNLGAEIIDADKLAREVLGSSYRNSKEIKNKIKNHFDKNINPPLFNQDDELNRAYLGEIVFSDKQKLAKLNEILHPEIQDLFIQKLQTIAIENIVIYDVPLLFETNMQSQLKATILVYCSEEQALERAKERDGGQIKSLKERMKAQISIEKKREMADYVIDNTSSRTALHEKVYELWKTLKTHQNHRT